MVLGVVFVVLVAVVACHYFLRGGLKKTEQKQEVKHIMFIGSLSLFLMFF